MELRAQALSYVENEAAKAITAALTVSDGDNVNLAGATIRITSNYVNGQNVLSFTNTGTITRTWDAAAGTLTLTGSDTLANYQAALRAVKYQNTSHSPSTATRTVSFKVHDGAAGSNIVTRNVAFTAVNEAPVFGRMERHELSYTVNEAAKVRHRHGDGH